MSEEFRGILDKIEKKEIKKNDFIAYIKAYTDDIKKLIDEKEYIKIDACMRFLLKDTEKSKKDSSDDILENMITPQLNNVITIMKSTMEQYEELKKESEKLAWDKDPTKKINKIKDATKLITDLPKQLNEALNELKKVDDLSTFNIKNKITWYAKNAQQKLDSNIFQHDTFSLKVLLFNQRDHIKEIIDTLEKKWKY